MKNGQAAQPSGSLTNGLEVGLRLPGRGPGPWASVKDGREGILLSDGLSSRQGAQGEERAGEEERGRKEEGRAQNIDPSPSQPQGRGLGTKSTYSAPPPWGKYYL